MNTVRSCLLVLMALAAVCARAQDDRPSMDVPNDDAPIEMTALDVEGVINRPWLYAETSGVQILSLASRSDTVGFIEALRDDAAFFAKLVPEIPQTEAYAESTVILKSPAFAKIKEARGSKLPILSYLTVLNAGLDRSICLFGDESTLPKHREGRSATESAAGFFYQHYKSRLLGKHRELPEWYRRGIENCGIYQTRDTKEGFHGYSVSRDTMRVLGLVGPSLPGVTVWPLEKFLAITRPAIEVSAMPRHNSPEGKIYSDQCVFFLHWGLRGGGDKQREAFRRFVAAACKRPVDEALFQECFGFGFDEAQQRFDKFVNAEIKAGLAADTRGGWLRPGEGETTGSGRKDARDDQSRSLHITSGGSSSLLSAKSYEFLKAGPTRGKKTPKIEVKPARLSEVWRIMGEAYLWSAARRGQVDRQRRSNDSSFVRYKPILAAPEDWYAPTKSEAEKRFLSKAQELVYKVYDDGKAKDPQLLALLGQLELTAGNRAKAVEFLQKAVEAGAPRPSIYYTQARLRLEELLEVPRAAGTPMPVEQIEAVRALLREALRQMPEMEPAYGTLAYAWRFSGEIPTASDLDALVRSVRWFPENVETTRAIAALCKKAGRDEQAAALAKIGLDWLPKRAPADLRAELTELAISGKPAGK